MRGQKFYMPRHVPPQVAAFDSETRQLGVGKAGKNGLLQAELRPGGPGETVLAGAYSEIPLHIQRVLRDGGPLAHLYVASASGGILQGDRYRMDFTAREGAMAHITTQGATRIYSMDSNCATQVINVRAERGSYLEIVPDQIIPYRDSRFYQETSMDVHSEATVAYTEVVAAGRTGMGESFEYDACCLRMSARDELGRYRIIDAACMEPKRRGMSAFGVMGGYGVVGTAYVLAPARHVRQMRGDVSAALSELGAFGGVTVTAGGTGLLARVLGDRADDVSAAVRTAVRAARETVAGVPYAEPRKS